MCHLCADSITLVDYEGAITFGTIEMLLSKLRNSREFQELNKPARKRLYGIFVESIDNIYKYAVKITRETGAASKNLGEEKRMTFTWSGQETWF